MDQIVMRSRHKDYLHSGIRTVKIATYITTAIFKAGYGAILKIILKIEIKIGSQCKQYVDSYDVKRMKRQERASLSGTTEARVARRMNQIQEQEFFEKSEGFLYGSTIAN